MTNFLINFALYISIPVLIRYVFLRRPLNKKLAAVLILLPIYIIFAVILNETKNVFQQQIAEHFGIPFNPRTHMFGSPILVGAMLLSYYILRSGKSVPEIKHTQKISKLPEADLKIELSNNGNNQLLPTADEEFWAMALAEYEGGSRRLGLWARVFSDAQGNEAVAKANYLKHRAEELSHENHQRVLEQQRVEQDTIEKARLAKLAEEKRTYEALPKGRCPNCEAVIPLGSGPK